MKITFGKAGLEKTWQDKFPETTECCRCKGVARVGFVAHESMQADDTTHPFICDLHQNEKGALWLHDCCAVAVYFCKECLETTALYNQA